MRKYTVDESFFEEITKDSAWMYGWVVTDGFVDNKRGQLKIALNTKDKDVLEKFKEMLHFTGNIRDSVLGDGRKSSTLTICRAKICKDIFKLGLAKENKTFNTTFPNVLPDEFYWDFIRGVFEGDGSIRHRTGNTDALDITICGATESFIKELQSTLAEHGVNTRMVKDKPNLWTINTKSNADALRMCFFMYANTPKSRRLDRKFAVYEEYINTYYDHIRRRSKPCIELVELSRQFIAA